jgi:GT2 family glycosyltransferase
MATGDVIISLDDDSYPVANDFLARLGQLFEDHPEAAVIAFPELRDGECYATNSGAETPSGHFAAAYANCAAAMRRQYYLEQPGFPPFFEHMYEEPDYALQCYGSGTAVWIEPSLVIRHHLSSANRQPIRRHHQNARNEIWSVWLRCPWPQLLAVSLFRVWRQLRYAWSQGLIWAMCEPLWWFQTLPGSFQCLRARRPIAWRTYYQWMQLARNPIPSIGELKRAFPGTKGE